MEPTSHSFPANARVGLADPILQTALGLARSGFPLRRRQAIERLPEFEELREVGRAIKDHTLAHLDFYLELYEQNVTAAGGQVHWARTAEEARAAVLEICRSVSARIVTKGKSMVAEEIALNDHLEANGITPVETDLGEYIIQLRHEPPSHIIAPAIHLMKEQVADAFRAAHTDLDPARPLVEARAMCDEARSEFARGASWARCRTARASSGRAVQSRASASASSGDTKAATRATSMTNRWSIMSLSPPKAGRRLSWRPGPASDPCP